MLQKLIPHFDLSPGQMDTRLSARITGLEFFVLALQLLLLAGYTYLDMTGGVRAFSDYYNFVNPGGFYYGFWMMPVIQGLNLLPSHLNVILWALFNLVGVWFAARVFGANVPLAIGSFQMLYVMFYGNLVGIAVGALGLMWWALYHRHITLAGVAFLIACTKFQVGVPIGLTLLLLAEVTWFDRLRVGLVVLIGVAISLLIYPNWPITVYEWFNTAPPNTTGSISLWRWIGPASLILWIPPLFLKMPTGYRLVAIVTTLALAVPYFQQTDLLALFVLPIGGLPLLGNLGYPLFIAARWSGLRWLVIVPILSFIWVILKGRQNAGTI